MEDYLNIKSWNKRYVQRNEFSKLMIFNDDGTKETYNNLSELPKEEQELLKDAIKIKTDPDRYFTYTSFIGEIKLTKFIGNNIENMVIPEKIHGVNIVSIEGISNNEIKSVYIPDTVKKLSKSCFESCKNLENIYLSENIDKIPYSCFSYCKNLKKINLDNIEIIEDHAFYDCSSLNNLNLNKVELIGFETFARCSSLKDIKMPNLTSIGTSSFDKCSSLQTVFLGDNLKAIEQYAFFNCSKLQSIKLPKELIKINDCAFFGCTNLKTIDFPEKLNIIEYKAFSNSGLEGEITFPKNLRKIDDCAFDTTSISKINISKFTQYKNSSFPLSGLIDLNEYDTIKAKIKNIFKDKER